MSRLLPPALPASGKPSHGVLYSPDEASVLSCPDSNSAGKQASYYQLEQSPTREKEEHMATPLHYRFSRSSGSAAWNVTSLQRSASGVRGDDLDLGDGGAYYTGFPTPVKISSIPRKSRYRDPQPDLSSSQGEEDRQLKSSGSGSSPDPKDPAVSQAGVGAALRSFQLLSSPARSSLPNSDISVPHIALSINQPLEEPAGFREVNSSEGKPFATVVSPLTIFSSKFIPKQSSTPCSLVDSGMDSSKRQLPAAAPVVSSSSRTKDSSNLIQSKDATRVTTCSAICGDSNASRLTRRPRSVESFLGCLSSEQGDSTTSRHLSEFEQAVRLAATYGTECDISSLVTPGSVHLSHHTHTQSKHHSYIRDEDPKGSVNSSFQRDTTEHSVLSTSLSGYVEDPADYFESDVTEPTPRCRSSPDQHANAPIDPSRMFQCCQCKRQKYRQRRRAVLSASPVAHFMNGEHLESTSHPKGSTPTLRTEEHVSYLSSKWTSHRSSATVSQETVRGFFATAPLDTFLV